MANQTDTLFFEPPYQQGASDGNGSLPTQANTALNVWQSWNAYVGGYWDNDGVAGPGTGVMPLSTFLTDFPLATIQNGGYSGLGGIALQVGFGSSGDTYQGYVDAFTIGIAGVNTTYNFDPAAAAAVPLPSSFWGGVVLFGGLGAWQFVRRRSATWI
jgi:hypothetical protein